MNLTSRFLSILFSLVTLAHVASAVSFKEIPELEKFFKGRGVAGTFVLLDPAADTMFVWNQKRAKQRFIPASTFKIANTLIGLDVAIYQELARRIGLARMREGVKKLGYGNMKIGGMVDRFWLDGPLKISAVEQTQFLNRLDEGKLPIKPDAVAAVREITLLEKNDVYALHGKTGWGQAAKPQIGWWVGWVEREHRVYPFAINIDMMSDKDAEKRIPIGRECLKALGKL